MASDGQAAQGGSPISHTPSTTHRSSSTSLTQQQQQRQDQQIQKHVSPSHPQARPSSPSLTQPPRPLEPFGPPGKASTTIREILAIGTLVCAMLITQAGLGQVILPLVEIAETFGAQDSPGRQSWFAAAYSLSVGTVILPAGRLGDMHGHKRLILIGYSWASLWSLVAGLSHYAGSDIFFDVCRGLQGIGFSILLPNAAAMLARCTENGHWRRALYFTVFAASAPNGFVLGAIFASLLTQLAGVWEWSFYLSAICIAAITVLAALTLPSDRYLNEHHAQGAAAGAEDGEKSPAGHHKPKFDYIGTLLAVSGLILFNFAWNQAAVTSWSTAYNPVLLVVGMALIAVFLYYESRIEHPLIPTNIWTFKNSIMLGCIALGWSSFGIWNLYSVRWWIEVRGASLLSATAMTSPATIAGCIAAPTSILILNKFGASWVMFFAMCAFMTANALLASMPEQQLYWKQSFPSWCIAPFGMDMSFPAASLIIAATLPPHQQGVAGSLVNTIINYSVALGLGIAGTVEVQTSNNGANLYNGYRGALYLGTGLAGLGVLLALANVVGTMFVEKRKGKGASSAADEKTLGDDQEGSLETGLAERHADTR